MPTLPATELTGDELVILREIYGIPRLSGVAFTSFTHIPPLLAKIWEPTYTIADFSDAWNAVMAQVNQLNAYEISRLRTPHFARWDEIGPTSVTRITSSQGGDAGLITDDERERELIREAVGNIVGLVVPQGGFYADLKVRLAYSSARNQLQGGDR
jgi:hypothetical protein